MSAYLMHRAEFQRRRARVSTRWPGRPFSSNWPRISASVPREPRREAARPLSAGRRSMVNYVLLPLFILFNLLLFRFFIRQVWLRSEWMRDDDLRDEVMRAFNLDELAGLLLPPTGAT
jgi:hypothetical protein